jgi:hypothetical protein
MEPIDQGDPEIRIADLERQEAEQKRISELERQLADAKASTPADHGVQRPLYISVTPSAAAQDDDALERGIMPPSTGQSFLFVPQRRPQPFDGIGPHSGFDGRRTTRGRAWTGRQRPRSSLRAKVSNNVGWSICLCIGAAAVLTAVFPSTALWMGGLVCRRSYQLTYSTSGYSYRPGQSGTSISFRCVSNAGSYESNELLIFGLQALLVTVVVCAAVVVAGLLWRLLRKPSDRRKAT